MQAPAKCMDVCFALAVNSELAVIKLLPTQPAIHAGQASLLLLHLQIKSKHYITGMCDAHACRNGHSLHPQSITDSFKLATNYCSDEEKHAQHQRLSEPLRRHGVFKAGPMHGSSVTHDSMMYDGLLNAEPELKAGFTHTRFVVLDEADRLLDATFQNDLKTIFEDYNRLQILKDVSRIPLVYTGSVPAAVCSARSMAPKCYILHAKH
eukprot:1139518-Pelagomonas_calceolata.AAC.2